MKCICLKTSWSLLLTALTVQLKGSLAQQDPINQVIDAGSPITLSCTSTGSQCHVQWNFCGVYGGDSCCTIYDNQDQTARTCSPGYSVTVSGSVYTLTVSRTTSADAGTYVCRDTCYTPGAKSAVVGVICSDLSISSSASGCVPDGDEVTLTAQVRYNGSNLMPVLMTWTPPEDIVASGNVTNSSGWFQSSVHVTARAPEKIGAHTCTVSIQAPTGNTVDGTVVQATNAPTYTKSNSSTPINVGCEHGGTCAAAGNGYACQCISGYTGSSCETDVDECSSNPCLNGGSCDNDVNRYTCQCASGYTGTSCETATGNSQPSEMNTGVMCFPGDSVVRSAYGHSIRMSELSVGEHVLTVDMSTGQLEFSKVTAFMHREVNAGAVPFIWIRTQIGMQLEISHNHLIFVSDTPNFADATPTFASLVKVGQYVFLVNGFNGTQRANGQLVADALTAGRVISVSTVVRETGLYAPLTTSGTIVVDGILASCYASFSSQRVLDVLVKIGHYVQEYVSGQWLDSSWADSTAWLKQFGRAVFPDSWWFKQ